MTMKMIFGCLLALYFYDGDGVNKKIICKQTQLLSPIYFPVKYSHTCTPLISFACCHWTVPVR